MDAEGSHSLTSLSCVPCCFIPLAAVVCTPRHRDNQEARGRPDILCVSAECQVLRVYELRWVAAISGRPLATNASNADLRMWNGIFQFPAIRSIATSSRREKTGAKSFL